MAKHSSVHRPPTLPSPLQKEAENRNKEKFNLWVEGKGRLLSGSGSLVDGAFSRVLFPFNV